MLELLPPLVLEPEPPLFVLLLPEPPLVELLLPEPPLVELPEPVLMTRYTVLPGSSSVPLVGVWLMTLPEETELLA